MSQKTPKFEKAFDFGFLGIFGIQWSSEANWYAYSWDSRIDFHWGLYSTVCKDDGFRVLWLNLGKLRFSRIIKPYSKSRVFHLWEGRNEYGALIRTEDELANGNQDKG